MDASNPSLPPGSLRDAVEATTEAALACGALRPIETEQLDVDDGGVRFLVRVVSSLRRKAGARRSEGRRSTEPDNPFLPPEPELTVGQLAPAHVAVLNKYKVLPLHRRGLDAAGAAP